jgi:hypothetical protein
MRRTHKIIQAALLAALVADVPTVTGQNGTLGLADGFLSFNTSTFSMQLVADSQTLYSLSPTGSTFDFIPTDMSVDSLRDELTMFSYRHSG